jgi:uncharacterized protein YcgL (UPF0745 family)
MMKCWIYKSMRRPDHYLYSDRADDLPQVPAALHALLGPLDFVMELELSPARRLAQADVETVLAALRDQGYYLQMPPRDAEQ